MVRVKDNDTPSESNPTITIASDVNYIAEGSTASFTLEASHLPTNNTDVNVVFSLDNENFIATSETVKTKTETITSTGEKTVKVTFATKADSPDGDTNGLITATSG